MVEIIGWVATVLILLGYYLSTIGDSVELHNALLSFIGGMVGGILGVIVFLVAIIKS